MGHDDVFAQYYENLLRAQYRVSEIIEQPLPRGTIREDFLRELVLKRRDSLRGKKGFVTHDSNQSGECDLIFYDQNSPKTPLGEQIAIEPCHCKLVLEVKSNATKSDFIKTNNNFEQIKSLDLEHPPKCGLFCYNTDSQKETVLKQFGYIYDEDLESWEFDSSLKTKYPNIDFVINIASINDDEDFNDQRFFLIKDELSGTFTLSLEYPIIKNFFAITDNM